MILMSFRFFIDLLVEILMLGRVVRHCRLWRVDIEIVAKDDHFFLKFCISTQVNNFGFLDKSFSKLSDQLLVTFGGFVPLCCKNLLSCHNDLFRLDFHRLDQFLWTFKVLRVEP